MQISKSEILQYLRSRILVLCRIGHMISGAKAMIGKSRQSATRIDGQFEEPTSEECFPKFRSMILKVKIGMCWGICSPVPKLLKKSCMEYELQLYCTVLYCTAVLAKYYLDDIFMLLYEYSWFMTHESRHDNTHSTKCVMMLLRVIAVLKQGPNSNTWISLFYLQFLRPTEATLTKQQM